jgi:hypothetical protein
MPNTPAATGSFSVIVTKPGHDTIGVGPFTDSWSARSFAHALDHSVRGTGAPAGTTLDITGYDPALPHLPLPATDPAELARQIDQESDQAGPAGFPDLFTRLVAHRGWEDAARAWLEARAHRAPAVETDPAGGEQPDAQQTFTSSGITSRDDTTPSPDGTGIPVRTKEFAAKIAAVLAGHSMIAQPIERGGKTFVHVTHKDAWLLTVAWDGHV